MKIFEQCIHLLNAGKNLALVTVIRTSQSTPGKPGFKLILADDESLYGTVGGGALEHRAVEEAREVLKDGESRIVQYNLAEIGMKCGGEASLVIEYLQAGKRFILFGGGHVGRALAPILEALGFQVWVYDSREEVRTQIKESLRERVTIAAYNDISPIATELKQAGFCFIATHGHDFDYAVLKQILETSDHYDYVGLIGSRNKVRTTLKRLRSEGVEIPDYLFAPVGIDLGGDTAAEIAVSIAAEVIARTRGTKVRHMRDSAPTD